MLTGVTDKLVYPAPAPTYTAKDMNGALCWLPWNEAIPTPPSTSSTSRLGIQTSGGSPDGGAGYLPCLWIQSKKSANVVFYFHANAEDLGVVHSALVHLQRQLQVSVLAIEYPGYGLLKHMTPSEGAICNAALVALRYIVSEVGVPYSQVMLLGRSLGSGPAVHLAARFPVGGLLLINPFCSLRAAAAFHMGKVLADVAFADSFKNVDLIGNVSCAVLFIHAAGDRTVPMEHSARLFKKCRSRKLLVTPDLMEHNSHLFADPQYLAVPAIHFFHFPCYQTNNPPTLPAKVFRAPACYSSAAQGDGLKAWSCASRFCASGTAEDEVSVPAGASVSGQVNVSDERKPFGVQAGAGAKFINPCPGEDRGSNLLPPTSARIDSKEERTADEEATFYRTPLSARNRYPETKKGETVEQVGPGANEGTWSPSSSPAPPVAPGDESAGWPAGDREKLEPFMIHGSVALDKLPSHYSEGDMIVV